MQDFNDDEYIDVCQNIEAGLRLEYEKWPSLSDAQCAFALDNAKTAIKKEYGFAKNERVASTEETQGIIQWCVLIGKERIDATDDFSLKEYLARIDKIRKSVVRHSAFGRRGYYEFIREYV